MIYKVTFANSRTVNVVADSPMTDEAIKEKANKQHGSKDYVYNETFGRAEWIDIQIPEITSIQPMREVYQGGGYCLVPA